MAECVEIESIIKALKTLITPRECESPDGERRAVLLNTLELSISALEDRLLNAPEWKALGVLRARVIADAKWFEGDWSAGSDPHWRFTCEALLLLQCLKERMIEVAASFDPPKPNLRTPEAAPALSPDTLSVFQQKAVQAAFQFVVCMGICPYLLPGIGLPLQQCTEFGALMHRMVSSDLPSTRTRRLYISCTALLDVSLHPSLGSLLLTNHLGDLMAGLCQLGYCPAKSKAECSTTLYPKDLTEGERIRCKDALRGLLDQVYQPLVIRQLLMLQGGPKQQGPCPPGMEGKAQRLPAPAWLRRLCGQLLSERLMKPHGVQAVVRGILEGAGDGVGGGRDAEAAASNWKKCDAVARILASCPQQSLSVEEYFQRICPQVLDLLHIQNTVTARQFQRVATETFLTVAREQPQLADTLLFQPMLGPLTRCTHILTEDRPPPGEILVSEKELSQCVEDVVKVFVVVNDPTSTVLNFTRQVLSAVFSLYCFARQNVSHLRSPCQDILLWFLDKSARDVTVTTLAGLVGIDPSVSSMPSYCHIIPGGHGGAAITIKEPQSDDEDDALYEKLSWEQWKTQCLVELLSASPSRGLAADFFLFCLKKLTSLVTEEVDAEPRCGDNLLDLERELASRSQSQERRLQLLHVLSVLCERISDSIFTDIQQVVDFVAVTLERACKSLAVSKGGTVASQTLSMAMGLVAAALGGAVKLTSPDFKHLKRLLPLLEQVSLTYPEPVIQELAGDLRISIATHCAVQLPPRAPGGPAPAEGIQKKASVREGCNDTKANSSDLQEILHSVRDAEIPTRAAALRSLTRLLEQRQPDALELRDQALQLFLDNLEEEDPFVYLSAIQGVAVLAGEVPDRVLPALLVQYGNSASPDHKARSPETRMKVGEALMRCTRALGDVVSRYRDPLIHAFLRGCRDQDGSLRASSLSNLGELCQHLHFSLGPVIHEVSSCLSAIVRTDPEVQVRRAAIHVVVLLLRGLSERVTEVLQDVLLDLYRLLKFAVRCETDAVSVLHAQLGLEELDRIMRALLVPAQKLEKKITVLP